MPHKPVRFFSRLRLGDPGLLVPLCGSAVSFRGHLVSPVSTEGLEGKRKMKMEDGVWEGPVTQVAYVTSH